MENDVTTIQVKKSVVEELNKAKKYRRETYSDVISYLIEFIKNEKEKEEFDKFVMEAQKEKMKELWGEGDYTAWENA